MVFWWPKVTRKAQFSSGAYGFLQPCRRKYRCLFCVVITLLGCSLYTLSYAETSQHKKLVTPELSERISSFINAHSGDKHFCPAHLEAVVIGSARDLKTGAPIYCEYHIAVQTSVGLDTEYSKLTVVYVDSSGQEIAQKSVDYSPNRFQPQITQVDFRTGESRLAYLDQGKWLVEYKERRSSSAKQRRIDLSDQGVVDSGFNQFIKARWDTLLEGTPLVAEFLSVPHRKAIDLQVKQVSCELKAKRGRECFLVQVNNAFLRLITGELQLVYNEQKQLLRFEGVVNIQNDAGETQKAVIHYRYEQ